MGHALQMPEHRLDVRQIVDQIREQEVIERLLRAKFARLRRVKLEPRVPSARLVDHALAEIDAHTRRGFHRGQEIPQAAAQLEHP